MTGVTQETTSRYFIIPKQNKVLIDKFDFSTFFSKCSFRVPWTLQLENFVFFFSLQAMWMMLQQEKPDDFVIATGVSRSVREFVEASFAYVGRKIKWEGEGVDEVGKDAETDELLVRVNPKFFRPTEVVRLFFFFTFHWKIEKNDNSVSHCSFY